MLILDSEKSVSHSFMIRYCLKGITAPKSLELKCFYLSIHALEKMVYIRNIIVLIGEREKACQN